MTICGLDDVILIRNGPWSRPKAIRSLRCYRRNSGSVRGLHAAVGASEDSAFAAGCGQGPVRASASAPEPQLKEFAARYQRGVLFEPPLWRLKPRQEHISRLRRCGQWPSGRVLTCLPALWLPCRTTLLSKNPSWQLSTEGLPMVLGRLLLPAGTSLLRGREGPANAGHCLRHGRAFQEHACPSAAGDSPPHRLRLPCSAVTPSS